MRKILSCAFNLDTACVELRLDDGTLLSIDCTAVEKEVANSMYQRGAFPLPTLLTNLLGAILIGLVVGAGQRWSNLSPTLLLFLRVGVCGGFTTFSTFSLESLVLLEDGRPVLFGGYVLLSVTLCLAGVWLGKHLIA